VINPPRFACLLVLMFAIAGASAPPEEEPAKSGHQTDAQTDSAADAATASDDATTDGADELEAAMDDAPPRRRRKPNYALGAPEFFRAMRATLSDTPGDIRVDRDVVYRRVAGRELRLDIYRPADPVSAEAASGHDAAGTRQTAATARKTATAARLPVIMYVHGGGWKMGDKRRQVALHYDFVRRGYASVSVNYRLTDEGTFPACVVDCRAALRWIRRHADEYGFDPRRIGLVGSSAGGHIAALMGTASDKLFAAGDFPDESVRVAAVVARFGVFDIRGLGDVGIARVLVDDLMGGPESERPALYQQASPQAYVEAQISRGGGRNPFPPFMLIHGDRDRIVAFEQSRRMHDALTQAGCDSTLIRVRGGVHGLLIGEMNPPPDECRARMFEFLDRHVKGTKG
jgi:acetyl esterase/lipase